MPGRNGRNTRTLSMRNVATAVAAIRRLSPSERTVVARILANNRPVRTRVDNDYTPPYLGRPLRALNGSANRSRNGSANRSRNRSANRATRGPYPWSPVVHPNGTVMMAVR